MIQMILTMQLPTMQLPSKRCNSYQNLGWRKRGLPHQAALLGPGPLASFLACQHCKIYPACVQGCRSAQPCELLVPLQGFLLALVLRFLERFP